jgi:hypothetical protein
MGKACRFALEFLQRLPDSLLEASSQSAAGVAMGREKGVLVDAAGGSMMSGDVFAPLDGRFVALGGATLSGERLGAAVPCGNCPLRVDHGFGEQQCCLPEPNCYPFQKDGGGDGNTKIHQKIRKLTTESDFESFQPFTNHNQSLHQHKTPDITNTAIAGEMVLYITQ